MLKATTLVLATGLGAFAAEPLPLVPQPVSVQRAEGAFPFTRETAIRHHRDLANEAKLFAADLGQLTGAPVRTYAAELRIFLASQIVLDLDPGLDVPAAGYRLEITPTSVKITGKDAAGAFHGTRSVLQLLPPGRMADDSAPIPAATITDYPRFGWRGMHLDVGRHLVFSFIDEVLTEVCAIFPSAYIHIGGDEAPKDQWNASPRVKELMTKENLKDGHEVQSYFIKRVEKILEAKGRKLIGWDEIREGGLSPKATVMSWRGEDGGIASAKEGHDGVMAPNSHTYFDHYQAPAKDELAKGVHFEAIGGFLPIGKVYAYDPVPKALNTEEAKHILGVQAQPWSEYFHDFKKVEYHAFPRIAALAEVAWTPLAAKDYDQFRVRLASILKHYDAAGLNRGEPHDPPKPQTKDGGTVQTTFGHHAHHRPEAAYDGKADTFFWSDREPRAGDHFTLHLKAPLAAAKEVTVTTGGPAAKNGDRLEQGVLEVSPDGTVWIQLAEFADGKAATVIPAGTTRLRIAVTANQTNWLIIPEIPL